MMLPPIDAMSCALAAMRLRRCCHVAALQRAICRRALRFHDISRRASATLSHATEYNMSPRDAAIHAAFAMPLRDMLARLISAPRCRRRLPHFRYAFSPRYACCQLRCYASGVVAGYHRGYFLPADDVICRRRLIAPRRHADFHATRHYADTHMLAAAAAMMALLICRCRHAFRSCHASFLPKMLAKMARLRRDSSRKDGAYKRKSAEAEI